MANKWLDNPALFSKSDGRGDLRAERRSRLKRGVCPACGVAMRPEKPTADSVIWKCRCGHLELALKRSKLYRLACERLGLTRDR